VQTVTDELGEEGVEYQEGGENHVCEMGRGGFYLVPHLVYQDKGDYTSPEELLNDLRIFYNGSLHTWSRYWSE
jgi:hypothetical protein